MTEILDALIRARCASRGPFGPDRRGSFMDLVTMLRAARAARTAHVMQVCAWAAEHDVLGMASLDERAYSFPCASRCKGSR